MSGDSAYSEVQRRPPTGGRPTGAKRMEQPDGALWDGTESSISLEGALDNVARKSPARAKSTAASYVDSLFDQMKLTDARRHIFPYVR